MKMRVWHLARPIENDRFEAEEVYLDLELPVVFVPGSLLKLPGTPELVCVDQVLWDADEPDVVHLFSRDPARLPTMQEMRAEGWCRAQSVRSGPTSGSVGSDPKPPLR